MTQALLDRLVESLPTTRLLLLVNYRPGVSAHLGQQDLLHATAARPAATGQCRGVLTPLLGTIPAWRRLPQLLIARTEAIPSFWMESGATLVETEVLVGTSGAYRLVQPLRGMQIPVTVGHPGARIDRLAPEDKRLSSDLRPLLGSARASPPRAHCNGLKEVGHVRPSTAESYMRPACSPALSGRCAPPGWPEP